MYSADTLESELTCDLTCDELLPVTEEARHNSGAPLQVSAATQSANIFATARRPARQENARRDRAGSKGTSGEYCVGSTAQKRQDEQNNE